MKEFVINKNDAGQRLDRFTSKTVPLLPTSLTQKYIRIKRIKVNGKAAKRDYKLFLGDTVQMYVNDEFFEVPNDGNAYLAVNNPALDIVYEDDNIMLLNKPVGVLCHSAGEYVHGSLVARVQSYMHQTGQWRPKDENSFAPALCNRIDRNTSGIVIAAKNAQALRIINEKIKDQEIDKYYLAVVHGRPSPASGRLEGHIFKDAVKNRVYVTKNSQPGSKQAVMEYKTISASKKGNVKTAPLTLLECRLLTGRTHQIRAQLADIGHPLLGDSKYGSKRLDKQFGEEKQALCSYKLLFSFKTDAGPLSYLNGQEFTLQNIPFVKKYF